jgi:hemoglobin-like flavoprotein
MKLVLAVVLCVCLAQAYAESCDALQRFKVKQQWGHAFGDAHERLEFGLKLWNSFFHDYPKLRELFKRVHGDNTYSPEFEAHSQRVLGGLDMTISLVDDPPALIAQLAHLKAQHAERNVKAEYYEAFRDELLQVLPDYLGTKLDYAAWMECMTLLISGIKS